MSSVANEGRQSPPPESQTGAQLGQPADGTGVANVDKKPETNKSELENLSSNPKGPLEDAAKDKVSKTVEK